MFMNATDQLKTGTKTKFEAVILNMPLKMEIIQQDQGGGPAAARTLNMYRTRIFVSKVRTQHRVKAKLHDLSRHEVILSFAR